MSITIYGASDDLVEVEGDVSEEFNVLSILDDHPIYIAVSDGSLIEVRYSGIWRFAVLHDGSDGAQLRQCPADDEDDYTDRLVIPSDVKWVVCGVDYAIRRKESVPQGSDTAQEER